MTSITRAGIVAAGFALVAGSGWQSRTLLADSPPSWGIHTWENGRIPFRLATSADTDHAGNAAEPLDWETVFRVMDQMMIWERAVSAQDPADPSRRLSYIDFYYCGTDCGDQSYVILRKNGPGESNNMCTYMADEDAEPGMEEHVGRNPAPRGVTQFHLLPGQDDNTIRHELGHCLGLWHEQNRADRDAWLIETPDADGEDEWESLFDVPVRLRGPSLMPLLANYDYDSIMHYRSVGPAGLRWTDRLGNQFSRTRLVDGVSPRDVSRVLQYYARDAQPRWGFFESLATNAADPDALPDPMLAPGVRAVGTPGVAWQSEGNYDVFSLGSDRRVYWKKFRRRLVQGFLQQPRLENSVGAWTSLGCCFDSDPAAVSTMSGHVDLVAIGNGSGRPLRTHLNGENWSSWTYVGGLLPSAIATGSGDRRVGGAIASRAAGLLDVFVVLDSGNLAVSTRVDGAWTAWTEFNKTVDVTARPAALAVSPTEVRLAVNADHVKLYEPLVTFDASNTNPTAVFGAQQATTADDAAPALAARANVVQPYRVLIVHAAGRVAHKFRGGGWRDIGGIPRARTGITAVGDGALGALIVMQGERDSACRGTCLDHQPAPGGYIQDAAIWTRRFY